MLALGDPMLVVVGEEEEKKEEKVQKVSGGWRSIYAAMRRGVGCLRLQLSIAIGRYSTLPR